MAWVVRRFCFCPPRKRVSDGQTDQPTNRQMDGRMDTPSYRVVCSRLKRIRGVPNFWKPFRGWREMRKQFVGLREPNRSNKRHLFLANKFRRIIFCCLFLHRWGQQCIWAAWVFVIEWGEDATPDARCWPVSASLYTVKCAKKWDDTDRRTVRLTNMGSYTWGHARIWNSPEKYLSNELLQNNLG